MPAAKKRVPDPQDIEFSDRIRPRHARGADAISLTGYKWSVYLKIERNGCCPHSTKGLEIPLGGDDFDRLIKMLRAAKKAAAPVRRYLERHVDKRKKR